MTITASQTDADSPIDQTLMDAIRLGLPGVLGYFGYSAETDMSGGGTGFTDITVDTTIDWRDRLIVVYGNCKFFGNTQGFTTSGANNDKVGSPYLTTG